MRQGRVGLAMGGRLLAGFQEEVNRGLQIPSLGTEGGGAPPGHASPCHVCSRSWLH